MEYLDYQTEKILFNPTVFLFNVDLKQSDKVNKKSPERQQQKSGRKDTCLQGFPRMNKNT